MRMSPRKAAPHIMNVSDTLAVAVPSPLTAPETTEQRSSFSHARRTRVSIQTPDGSGANWTPWWHDRLAGKIKRSHSSHGHRRHTHVQTIKQSSANAGFKAHPVSGTTTDDATETDSKNEHFLRCALECSSAEAFPRPSLSFIPAPSSIPHEIRRSILMDESTTATVSPTPSSNSDTGTLPGSTPSPSASLSTPIIVATSDSSVSTSSFSTSPSPSTMATPSTSSQSSSTTDSGTTSPDSSSTTSTDTMTTSQAPSETPTTTTTTVTTTITTRISRPSTSSSTRTSRSETMTWTESEEPTPTSTSSPRNDPTPTRPTADESDDMPTSTTRSSSSRATATLSRTTTSPGASSTIARTTVTRTGMTSTFTVTSTVTATSTYDVYGAMSTVVPPTFSPIPRPNSDNLPNNVGAIVGIILGTLVGLVVIVLAVFLFCRRRRRRVTPNSSTESILEPSRSPHRAYGASVSTRLQGALSQVASTLLQRKNGTTHDPKNEDATLSRDLSKRSEKSASTIVDGNPGHLHLFGGVHVLKSVEREVEEGRMKAWRDLTHAPKEPGSTQRAEASGPEVDAADQVTVRKRVSLPGPRPMPGQSYRSRRHTSTPQLDAETQYDTQEAPGTITEFGEVTGMSNEERNGSEGSLRRMWYRLSSGGRNPKRRSVSDKGYGRSRDTLKAPPSPSDVGRVHNPFGSIESLQDLPASVSSPPPSSYPQGATMTSLSRHSSMTQVQPTRPSSLLNPIPPTAIMSPPVQITNGSRKSSYSIFPTLPFPRNVTGNSYAPSASSSYGTYTRSASGTATTPWPPLTLPPAAVSPSSTLRTLTDEESVRRADGLLNPALEARGLGLLMGPQQPSLTSLRDHLDYSRPLGSVLVNNSSVDGHSVAYPGVNRSLSAGSGSSAGTSSLPVRDSK